MLEVSQSDFCPGGGARTEGCQYQKKDFWLDKKAKLKVAPRKKGPGRSTGRARANQCKSTRDW